MEKKDTTMENKGDDHWSASKRQQVYKPNPTRFYGANPENAIERTNSPESIAVANLKINDPEIETPSNESYPLYEDLVGNTPLIDLTHLVKNKFGVSVSLYAKCEFFNPGFSIKDRIVRNILDDAEASGELKPGATVVAASSGNTGAATAMFCAMRGYQCIITTSQKCSKEKQDAIRAYGAKLILSPPGAKEGSKTHYMEIAKTLCTKNPEWFDINQYDNLKNPEGHYKTLGPEIWEQTRGEVTHFVAAGSTGGTISGTGKYLKECNPDVKVVLGDPHGSIFTNYFKTGELGTPGKFLVEGVGKGSIPGALNFDVIDSVIPVSDQEAFDMCHRLSCSEGLCVGGSGGLNVVSSLKLAEELTTPSVIVTPLPDLGVKYLSKIYNTDWLKENNLDIYEPAKDGIEDTNTPERETPPSSNPLPPLMIGNHKYSELIGNTPLVDLSHLMKNPKCRDTKVLAKCEFFNPGFSIKDRIVKNIFDKAEKSGELKPGSTVVAASSGNTGASTAMICAMRGYSCVIITSPKCSKEKMDAIRAYGAKLHVSEAGAKEGTPGHYMELAKKLKKENPTWFDVDQYDNLKNPEGHYLSLGPEIYQQTRGSVTHFVAAGSTGGTISGTTKFLKESNPKIKSILADPVGSIFTNFFKDGQCGKAKKFLVEGVGKGSIPGAMDFSVIDEVYPVKDQAAFDMCSTLARTTGICAGGSSGLNVYASLKYAEQLETPGVVVTVMPDLGVKYLSKVYNDEWLVENGCKCPLEKSLDGCFELCDDIMACNPTL